MPEIDDTHLAGGDEEALVTAFLADVRATVLQKVAGLSDDDARRPGVDSGTSLGGLVKHLALVERWWFGAVFRGDEMDTSGFPGTTMEPGERLADLVAEYEAAVRDSEAILAAATLDDLSTTSHHRRGHVTLRWIAWHVVEETARHNGHLDILREQLDGVTG